MDKDYRLPSSAGICISFIVFACSFTESSRDYCAYLNDRLGYLFISISRSILNTNRGWFLECDSMHSFRFISNKIYHLKHEIVSESGI